MRRPTRLTAVLVAAALAVPAAAERILDPAEAPHARLGAIARVVRLRPNPAALARLRHATTATVEDVPLAPDTTATLDLVRIAPFRAGAGVSVRKGAHAGTLPLPDASYFTGTVRDDPDSRVALVVTATGVRGVVTTGGEAFRLGPSATGELVAYALRDADAASIPAPPVGCANDLHPDAVRRPLGRAAGQVARTAALISAPREVEIALETDTELRAKFASDADALTYLGELVTAANVVYERDANVRLVVSYVRLWTGTDPWTAGAPLDALDQVRAYWRDPAHGLDAAAGTPDLVHFLSGKTVQGGVAYLSAACDREYGFGMSQVFGDFDVTVPTAAWDVVAFTHELGHNLGSPHTHCYSPPLDKCYGEEPGCYDGPEVASSGTLMSYCHLQAGGLRNIALTFGDTVAATVRAFAAEATCLTPAGTCGNGVVEGSEQCDDGATAGGDGCSALCRIEGCGNGETEPGEECDDGNASVGDGCSPDCREEPCQVSLSHQTVWRTRRLSVTRRPSEDRLVLRADFGVPEGAAVGPAEAGLRLAIDAARGVRLVDVTLPPGAAWRRRGARLVYRDPAGTAGGVRKASIRPRAGPGVLFVRLHLVGRGAYPVAAGDLPLVVHVVLGDAAAGRTGACGRRAVESSACAARARGTRLTCR